MHANAFIKRYDKIMPLRLAQPTDNEIYSVAFLFDMRLSLAHRSQNGFSVVNSGVTEVLLQWCSKNREIINYVRKNFEFGAECASLLRIKVKVELIIYA